MSEDQKIPGSKLVTGNEQLAKNNDDAIKNQSVSVPETLQPPTTNIEPQPSTMEVHHHTHTARKKWKHYLFEFFMLFLAVFCGFLAEYQLEHTIENNKEKQYIKSFAEDLEADNAYMEERLAFFDDKIKKADSLVYLFSSGYKTEMVNDIYYHLRFIGRHSPFDVNDRTIVQLRNAGGMRLISNKTVSDSMVNYYRYVDKIHYLDERLVVLIGMLGVSTDKLLDAVDFGKLTDTVNNFVLRVNEPLKLRTTDAETINVASLNVQRIKNITIAIKLAVRQLKERANATRQLILKEYHLE
jgi:hypothetical protein